jgi:hypothetical protein
MQERTKQVAASVTPEEKQAIREAAAAEGQSISKFVRERVLDGLPPAAKILHEPDSSGHLSPLEDFITARLTVDEDAGPVSKRDVHERYVVFCEQVYPNHDIETQHKVSREVANIEGVETGRAYVSSGDSEQTRCFFNLRFSNEIVE